METLKMGLDGIERVVNKFKKDGKLMRPGTANSNAVEEEAVEE